MARDWDSEGWTEADWDSVVRNLRAVSVAVEGFDPFQGGAFSPVDLDALRVCLEVAAAQFDVVSRNYRS